jgi:hypothetical protein
MDSKEELRRPSFRRAKKEPGALKKGDRHEENNCGIYGRPGSIGCCWVFVTRTEAETVNCKIISYITKAELVPVPKARR